MEKESKQVLFVEDAKRSEVVRTSYSTHRVYVFECSDCGVEIRAKKCHMKTHKGKCISCVQKMRPYEYLLTLLGKGHKRGPIEVDLTYEDLLNIVSKPFCHYCNKELIFNKHIKNQNPDGTPFSMSYQLDRKDNNLGYTKNNLVPCCWGCNRAKSNIYTYEEFMKLSPILKEIQLERDKNLT